jgi:dienelactone hydrolase
MPWPPLRACHVDRGSPTLPCSADWQLSLYGGAMHGFTHETATGQTPGVMYHAPSDARSSAAIKRFLDDLFSANNA